MEPTVAISEQRTDESLLRIYREGDEEAAVSLYRRYAPRLRKLAQRHCANSYAGRFDADDVLQSVFATFFQGIRTRNYTVPSNGEIWALLTVLALNKVRGLVEHHCANKRSVRSTDSKIAVDQILSNDDSAAGLLKLVVEEQLSGMPDSNAAIIRLRVLGHTVGEIAARTERSQRTVERVLQDFRKRMTDQ